jgi:hypothetical protein
MKFILWTKLRAIQRRSYGLRDDEYLRLKILTSMLPDQKFSGVCPHEYAKSQYFNLMSTDLAFQYSEEAG